jgi:hypothetical protein
MTVPRGHLVLGKLNRKDDESEEGRFLESEEKSISDWWVKEPRWKFTKRIYNGKNLSSNGFMMARDIYN